MPKILAIIACVKQICATNVAFGGPGGHDLFIAACDAVYRIRLKASGGQ